ncbi:MAG: transglutaminase domain-containing protein [Clostridiaceae bacterium]|nr:transglutaminase domain-containing protein [Clostridiaceae bacterium]
MKKSVALLTALLLLPSLFGINSFAKNSFLNKNSIENGVVGVTYQKEEDNIRYKVAISKGSEIYYYDYSGPGTEFYPLQLGNGEYKISLLKNISESKYMVVHSDIVQVKLENENVVYLQSIQNVSYEPGMNAVLKAEELMNGKINTLDKVKAVYQYIVSNIEYDYKFAQLLDKPHIPDIEKTYNTQKGICYDFAALFAAMLRSQGIPVKLVKGYSNNIEGYHAWNEVLIDGSWVTIDTTYDVTMKGFKKINMIKDKLEYQPERYY